MRAIPMFLTLAASAALGMSVTAQAQGGLGRGRGGMGRPGAVRPGTPPAPNPAANPAAQPPAPRPRVTGWGPAAMLLRQRERLQLTDEQVKRLEALANAPRPRRTGSDGMRARADLMDAMQGEGNLTAAKAAMDRMAALRTAQALEGMKRMQEARAVLTPAQRGMLQEARRGMAAQRMRGARGGRGGRGMMGGGRGGMRGGMGGGVGGGMRPGMRPGMGRGMGPGMGRGMGQGMGPGAPQPGAFPMLDRIRQRRGELEASAPPAPPAPPAPVTPAPSLPPTP